MIALGLLILLIAIALGVLLVIGASSPEVAGQKVDFSLFDTVHLTLSPLALIIAGMVVATLAWLGLLLIRSAMARKARRRRERKAEERAAQDRRAAAERAREQEREDLERRRSTELGDEQLATGTGRQRPQVAQDDTRWAGSGERTQPLGTRDATDRDRRL